MLIMSSLVLYTEQHSIMIISEKCCNSCCSVLLLTAAALPAKHIPLDGVFTLPGHKVGYCRQLVRQ